MRPSVRLGTAPIAALILDLDPHVGAKQLTADGERPYSGQAVQDRVGGELRNDEARIVGNMEQTVSMLSESTKLDYKTVQTALDRLAKYGMVKKSRRVGNAQTYRFNVENDLHPLISWAAEFQHSKRNRR